LADVSEAPTVFIIRALMIEAISTSETSVYLYQTRGTAFQKTVIFIHVAVRT
jgi:hypothetical protein